MAYQFTFQPMVYTSFHFPHPHKSLLPFIILIMIIVSGVTWCLTVVIICISLLIRDAEHLVICLLVILGLILRNVYSHPLSFLKSFFCYLVVWIPYVNLFYIYIYIFANVSYHYVDCISLCYLFPLLYKNVSFM